jgi:hypothetical protein
VLFSTSASFEPLPSTDLPTVDLSSAQRPERGDEPAWRPRKLNEAQAIETQRELERLDGELRASLERIGQHVRARANADKGEP